MEELRDGGHGVRGGAAAAGGRGRVRGVEADGDELRAQAVAAGRAGELAGHALEEARGGRGGLGGDELECAAAHADQLRVADAQRRVRVGAAGEHPGLADRVPAAGLVDPDARAALLPVAVLPLALPANARTARGARRDGHFS